MKAPRVLSLVTLSLLLVLAAAVFTGSSNAAGQSAQEKVDVLIGFASTPGKADEALVRSHGGSVNRTFHLVPAIAASLPQAAVSALQRNPRVTVIEADGKVYAVDTELDNTWGVKRIRAGLVHDGGNKATGIKVAVIDTGVDYGHAELTGNYAGGYDFVNNDADPLDDNGHGTHVSGTVAAADNDTGVVGAAPEARIYALKVLDSSGSGSFSSVIAAVQWAVDNGIQVTNNSYGSSLNPGSIVESAFNNADAAGVLSIAAAGNSGNCGGKGNNVGYPARYASVVAVAATNKTDSRPCFSSTGPDVELSAPGVTINSTKLGGGYIEYNGTSMATPHVVGAASLVIAAGITDGNANGRINDDVRKVLDDTAQDLGAAGRDNSYGYGLVDVAAAVAALAPPSPAVSVSPSTDKTNYVSGTDTTAVLTAVVKDESGSPITGLSAEAFATVVDGAAAAAAFSETATPGTYSANLDISGLADGSHAVEVTATDTRALSGTGTAAFTIGPASSTPSAAIVESITYSTSGGKAGDRHLTTTVRVVDDLGNPVAGAGVSITLTVDAGGSWSGTGVTNSDGRVQFTLNNAPSGCYHTDVTDVTASGLTWDGATPVNSFCK